MPLQGVILDVDGTLVLSNDAHAQAWVEAFADYGYEIEFDGVRPLIGMGGDQVVPRLVPGLPGDEGKGKEIADRRKELIIEKFGATLKSAPGSRELVERMRQDQLQLIIASSATSEELGILLKAAHVDDLLDEATTSSDADASKPAPDIVQAALKKIGLLADQVVMLGDTPYDIESARGASVDVIAFRCGDFPNQQLQGAIAIYDHPADLLAHYDESPLGRRQVEV